MPDPLRPSPFFVAESTALDFLNSVAKPKSVEFDWLETGADMLDWCVQAGLAHEDELKPLRSHKAKAELDQAAQTIRAFRDAFRTFIADASDAPLQARDHPMIADINRTLRQSAQHLQIEAVTDQRGTNVGPYTLAYHHRLTTADDLLPRIAAACARLICEADFRYVKNCEGPRCTLYFLDVSKNHTRRWCTMDVCGNRAKAAAYRKR